MNVVVVQVRKMLLMHKMAISVKIEPDESHLHFPAAQNIAGIARA